MSITFDTTSSTTRLAGPTSPMTRRRRSSFGGGTPTASTDICVQQALTSDEFVQRRKRRGGASALEHQSSDSALARQPLLNRKSIAIPPPKPNVGSSRDLSYGGKSPDANGSPALLLCSPSSASTIKASMFPRAAPAHDGSASERTGAKGPKRQPASRSFGSLQRPRSRPRSPRATKCGSDSSSIAPPSPSSSPSPSPSVLSRSGFPQQIHSDVHVPQRSISASSCPAPRGATLSLGPSTPIPLTSSILAEGQVELSTNLVAVEVLADLQCGRSVTSSECGDRDRERDHDFGSDFFVYDCTAPLSIPDVPPTDPDFAAKAGASLPSPRSPTYAGLVPLHPSGRSSTIRNHTAPLPVSDLDGMRAIDELRRCASASPMSTSPPHQGIPLSSLDKTSWDGGRVLASGQMSRSSSISRSSRNARFTSGEEKRLRHESEASSAQTTSPDGSKVLLKRPPLHTYTSFESAFDVAPPPSPPASPKGPNKGWPWQRS
ncbi:BQ5605_C003g02188 [Microbotryum silenes-dioicae]|uniref:BQ5605_C003g02188 protein n=1 Tax=Microbotryum silenes-dioicae TaxID=796604 RepID=A0A2X0M0X5_9BASI|nr:BQ5605_C003g02188 [Microbotryum silenes-dioicae]